MADINNQTTLESLKNELHTLRAQLEDMTKHANAKGHEAASDMAARIAHELHSYRRHAAAGVERVRDAGQSGLNEVEHQVRQNPLLSLLIAFGAGCIASCLMRHLR